MSSRAETAAGNNFVMASTVCICIGHSFHLGSDKYNMKISSVVRGFIHAGCPVRLWSGRQQDMHNPSAAPRISAMISISTVVPIPCTISPYRKVFQNKLSVFLKRKALLLSNSCLKRQDHKEQIMKAHHWNM